jgi:Family of unknown function (DUF6088)
MKSLIESCFYYIAGHGRGWAFSPSDLMPRYSRQQADDLLSQLAKNGKIRRLARGLYDYPVYSELLKKELSPDIDQVAQAYARKFNWRIEVSGDTALNLLGLSTQLPASYVYLSDGPSRSYQVMGQSLAFKKAALKHMGFKYRESALLVQAMLALGKPHITPGLLDKLRLWLKPELHDKVLKDTRSSVGWVYEAIGHICRSEHG